MGNFIEANLTKPSNEKIGKYFNIHESTVRKRIKESPELFDSNLIDYRMAKMPFISIDDYNTAKGTKYTIDNVLNMEIPAVLNKDGSYLIPTVWEELKIAKEEIKKFPGCNVISLSNYKGGVGKTSSLINISTALSLAGFDVLVVDSDIQGNTTSMFDLYREKRSKSIDLQVTNIEELYDIENSDFKYTIVDLMAEVGNDNIESMAKESIVNLNSKVPTIGKLDIIPNASNIENALKFEYIDKLLVNYGNINQALDEVLSYVKEDYDFILIDTPPSISLPLRMSIMATDYFILILTPDKMSKDGIAPFLVPIEMHRKTYRKEKGKDITVLGGILNKYQKNSKIQQANKDIIDEDLTATVGNSELGSANLFDQIIKLDNILNEAQYQTGSALIYNPTHELVRDYFNVSLEILERIVIDKMSKA